MYAKLSKFPCVGLSNICFLIWGSESARTQVYSFIDDMKDSELDKLESLLMAIDTKPHVFQHEHKFKKLEGDIWEIKIHQIRIACYWKGNDLIAFYGIRKKLPHGVRKIYSRQENNLPLYLQIWKIDCIELKVIITEGERYEWRLG